MLDLANVSKPTSNFQNGVHIIIAHKLPNCGTCAPCYKCDKMRDDLIAVCVS